MSMMMMVCVCACTCVYVHVCVCVGGSLELGWWPAFPVIPLSPPATVLSLQGLVATPDFLCWCWDKNLGPQACSKCFYPPCKDIDFIIRKEI